MCNIRFHAYGFIDCVISKICSMCLRNLLDVGNLLDVRNLLDVGGCGDGGYSTLTCWISEPSGSSSLGFVDTQMGDTSTIACARRCQKSDPRLIVEKRRPHSLLRSDLTEWQKNACHVDG